MCKKTAVIFANFLDIILNKNRDNFFSYFSTKYKIILTNNINIYTMHKCV